MCFSELKKNILFFILKVFSILIFKISYFINLKLVLAIKNYGLMLLILQIN